MPLGKPVAIWITAIVNDQIRCQSAEAVKVAKLANCAAYALPSSGACAYFTVAAPANPLHISDHLGPGAPRTGPLAYGRTMAAYYPAGRRWCVRGRGEVLLLDAGLDPRFVIYWNRLEVRGIEPPGHDLITPAPTVTPRPFEARVGG